MKLASTMAAVAALIAASGPGAAQTAPAADAQAAPAADAQAAPEEAAQEQDSLTIYFGSGSSQVDGDQQAMLDQAARLFREGSPIVMIVAGGADTVGAPDSNLDLSVRRAQAVADGLVARGIPAGRLQVLGRGVTELVVETDQGVDSRENRVVEITWR